MGTLFWFLRFVLVSYLGVHRYGCFAFFLGFFSFVGLLEMYSLARQACVNSSEGGGKMIGDLERDERQGAHGIDRDV